MHTLIRPYKNATPFETVSHITTLLSNAEILPRQVAWFMPNQGLYSTRLEIDDAGGFGANGKGISIPYCLASAYGELMEYLQGGFLTSSPMFPMSIWQELKTVVGFKRSPQETYITVDDFLNLPIDILNDLMPEDRQLIRKTLFTKVITFYNKYQGCPALPYFDCQKGTLINLPSDFIMYNTTSNGFAAGNTLDEALFQSMCEIIERFTLQEVFFKHIIPPNISKNFIAEFAQDAYLKIEKIEKLGNFEILIKDFSLGKKLPVICIVAINKQEKTFRINAGCDTSFESALNRALTEIFQGLSSNDDLNQVMYLQQVNTLPDNDSIEDQRNLQNEFEQIIHRGVGVIPTIFSQGKPSYEFDPSHFSTKTSYIDEVKSMVQLIQSLGYTPYFANLSFLGFPTVHTYIPGMSSIKRNHSLNPYIVDSTDIFEIKDIVINLMYKLETCTLQDLNLMALNLDKIVSIYSEEKLNDQIILSDIFNLEFSDKEDDNPLNYYVCYIATLIWIQTNNFQKASLSFRRYAKIKHSNNDFNLFDKCVELFISLKNEERGEEEIYQLLVQETQDSNISRTILDYLNDAQNILSFLKVPQCPHCDKCQLINTCLTAQKFQFTKRVYKKFQHDSNNCQVFDWITIK